MKQESISQEGVVIKELGNSLFTVRLDMAGEPEIICTISGKIRKNFIKILAGDRVKVEMSPYDLTRGRIATRLQTPGQNQVSINPSINNNKKKK